MIKEILLSNFKCFQKQHFEMKPLTVLMGLNGMGKSSLIQSLLLVRQSLQQSDLSHIILNGELIKIGKAVDLLYQDANDEIISIEIKFRDLNKPLLLKTKNYTPDADVCELEEANLLSIKKQSLFTDSFLFLKTERIGPRTVLPTSQYKVSQRHTLGNDGALVGQFIETFGSKPVPNNCLKHKSENDTSVRRQIEAWLNEISPGVRLETREHHTLDSMQIRFSFLQGKEESNKFRASNVGFGISFVLPVIAALLTPFKNSLIIIENPETHLHPAGQSAIGRLITCAVAAGHQVIVETHSDHLLNGIRVAIKEQLIKHSDVIIDFFDKKIEDFKAHTVVSEIKIDKNGSLSDYPKYFLDEWEQQLLKLI
ncbi:MAG: DUF3696 domain-containing protein [Planctomycetaceae bacterium]|jgi:predicted ATPase|nr:DUF3696 domain-containing protein [Planctomycetaceae bacterium]